MDLPGYGYAKVSKEIKEKWGRMIERYLQTSAQLKNIFLLLDIRHAPTENDRQMYAWIRAQGLEPAIILTKADKIKRNQLAKQQKLIAAALGAGAGTVMIPFSALTGQGTEEIWQYIETAVCGEQA